MRERGVRKKEKEVHCVREEEKECVSICSNSSPL
jgi:hypothetical protein